MAAAKLNFSGADTALAKRGQLQPKVRDTSSVSGQPSASSTEKTPPPSLSRPQTTSLLRRRESQLFSDEIESSGQHPAHSSWETLADELDELERAWAGSSACATSGDDVRQGSSRSLSDPLPLAMLRVAMKRENFGASNLQPSKISTADGPERQTDLIVEKFKSSDLLKQLDAIEQLSSTEIAEGFVSSAAGPDPEAMMSSDGSNSLGRKTRIHRKAPSEVALSSQKRMRDRLDIKDPSTYPQGKNRSKQSSKKGQLVELESPIKAAPSWSRAGSCSPTESNIYSQGYDCSGLPHPLDR